MTTSQAQHDDLCRAMSRPDFYLHSLLAIERRQTHISSVFLTGYWVYKIKKPVEFGFLDFRTLEARRRYCELEVALNQRLSRGIYLEVTPIYRDRGGRFTMEETGQVVEYAVKMKQLPDRASFQALLQQGKIAASHLNWLGELLAGFYERSAQGPGIDHYGSRKAIGANSEENFQQLAPFIPTLFDAAKWEFICQVNRSHLRDRAHLFERRIREGRIRDGHGDLRTDHIYFYMGIHVIDCIEFNERFRYGDVALDLAYLKMDLDYRGYPQWGRELIQAFVQASHDPGVYALIDFYAGYRSIVQAKVACLQGQAAESGRQAALAETARRHLEQAYRYALQFSRPVLWVLCGLPASGKTSLAEAVAKVLAIGGSSSDGLRQASGQSQVAAYDQGAYTFEKRQRVYAHLLAEAQERLKKGQSVVLDATFARSKWRAEAMRLARDTDASIVFAECRCPQATLRARLKQRERSAGPSDARLAHLEQIMNDFEALDELEPRVHLQIDTGQPLQAALYSLLDQGYRRQYEQIEVLG